MNSQETRRRTNGWLALFALLALLGSFNAEAQVTFSGTNWADAFLPTGSPTNPRGTNLTGLNYGFAGALFVAPASSADGEFQSIMKFNLSGATSLFNTTYGTNLWTISAITLTLTGNTSSNGEQPDNLIFPPIHGGDFVVEWLGDNNWNEGTGTPKMPTTDGVTYSSLPCLLSHATSILCTNTFIPPGDNNPLTYPLPLDTNLVADILTGGNATLLLYAADDQIAYLFNSHNFANGNQPLINVTANPTGPVITAGYFTNGWFHLTGMSAPNSSCQIQASTNLATTNWIILDTISADNTGLLQFDDTNAANNRQRFYRLSE